ncbi:hypothetical protein D3C87_1667790 [compost metagenome]
MPIARLGNVPDLFNGFQQPIVLHRFQQVIHRIFFKSTDRILVISCRKHHQRHFCKLGKHFEAIQQRHFNVEKNNVGLVFVDFNQSFGAVFGFRHDVESVGILFEQPPEAAQRKLFVVDQNGFKRKMHGWIVDVVQ